MGIDYEQYGLDAAAAVTAATQDAAIQAEFAATTAELAVLLETDEEDKAILAERAVEARDLADRRRKEAKMTKRELDVYRRHAAQQKRSELAQRHLTLDVARQSKASAGQPTDAEEQEQSIIEAALEAIEELLR